MKRLRVYRNMVSNIYSNLITHGSTEKYRQNYIHSIHAIQCNKGEYCFSIAMIESTREKEIVFLQQKQSVTMGFNGLTK